jgi:hypothetical protein
MMPPEDRARSPYTGWTRRHWAAVADRLLAGVHRYRSPLGATIDLPGPASRSGTRGDGLEGYARTFLLAGFRIAGERGADPTNLLERYAGGLATGTDPHSPEAWPRPDELGQAKVEAASIALVLRLTRPWLWDALDDAVRERALTWLGTVVGQPYPPINWVWFRVVVESFLREAGGSWSAADIEEDLAVHRSLRRTGGWLSDGPERAYDHYVGWALHLYPLLWTRLFDVVGTLCPPALRDQWAADLTGYLDDAVRLVGADGSPLLQGRSLTYRFAAAAPFWVGAYTGTGGLPPGLTRRAASGILRHFVDHGALGDDDVLSLGWHRAWPALRQAYSGPASPYWASNGLLGLALPEDHPVWTDVELPLPIEEGGVARVLTAPGWLVSARRDDGIVRVVNHGTDHASVGDTRPDAPLYAQLGYSTATSPLTGGDPGNSVVLLDAAGRPSHRSGFETLYLRATPGGCLIGASRGPVRWVDTDCAREHAGRRSAPMVTGGEVTVLSVVRDGCEVRCVYLGDVVLPGVVVRLRGWPLAADSEPSWAADEATVATAGLWSTVRGLAGFADPGADRAVDVSPLGRYASTPWLSAPAASGGRYAAAVALGRPGCRFAVPRLRMGADLIEIRWPDGLRTVLDPPVQD